MSYFEDASLVLIPSAQKLSKIYSVKPTDGTGDLTFTRSNDTASRIGPDGLIEKVRTNVALYSEQFDNAAWAKTFGASITANTAANPLTGTQTADTIIADAVNNFHYISQSVTYSAGEATLSIYAKANGYSWFVIDSGFSNAFGYFNLTTGAVGIKGSASTTAITSVGNGWYRCSVTFTATASASSLSLSIRNADNGGAFLGDGVSGFFIYGAQAETGVATDYIATTSAAVSVGPVANVPRLDYLNSSCPRLLLEPQRVNLLQFSEQLNNAAWTTFRSSVTANATTSPDGSTNAEKLIQQSGENDGGGIYQSLTIANATAHTYSFFAKAAGYNFTYARVSNSPSDFSAWFNLSTGVVGTTTGGVTSSSIVSYGNGWYRCSMTFTSAGTSATPHIYIANANGSDQTPAADGVKGIFAYGAMVEQGSYSTSYIPTLGAAVTRGADACSKTGISSLIGQTEGTLFAEFVHNGADILTTQSVISVNSGNTTNFVNIGVYDGRFNPAARGSGTNIFDLFVGPNPLPAGMHKIALAYKSGDFAIYLNGTSVYTNTNAVTFSLSQLDLGTFLNLNTQLGEGVNQALLFKTRLTNAQLAELTTL